MSELSTIIDLMKCLLKKNNTMTIPEMMDAISLCLPGCNVYHSKIARIIYQEYLIFDFDNSVRPMVISLAY